MGNFFTNYQVRTDNTKGLVAILEEVIQARAYMSNSQNGWVTVYDEASENQDEEELHRLACELSLRASTAVFAFLVHDDNILIYLLYERGKLLDEYNSHPDYFSQVDGLTRERLQGQPQRIYTYCVMGTTESAIRQCLSTIPPLPDPGYYASERLTKLVNLLGIDDVRATLGFVYFEEDPEMVEDAHNFRLIVRSD